MGIWGKCMHVGILHPASRLEAVHRKALGIVMGQLKPFTIIPLNFYSRT